MSEAERERFLEQVLDCARRRFPLVKLGRGQVPFSVMINGQLAPLENLYRRAALVEPSEVPRQIERWIVELLRIEEGQPDLFDAFEPIKDRVLPMVRPVAGADSAFSLMVSQPLVADLVIAYAVDGDRMIAYIPHEAFERWGIGLQTLHETAIANLEARSGELQAQAVPDDEGRVGLVMFQTLDGYDASRLLLPGLHDRLRPHLGSPFVAAIPNRDILLCIREDGPTLGRVRQQIMEDYHRMPHQITERLLLVTADGLAAREE